MTHKKKAAVFVRCTEEEGEIIRQAAKQERRTISDYILNAVLTRIEYMEKRRQAGARRRAC